MSRCLIFTSLLLSTTAFAGDVRLNVNLGSWRVGNPRQTRAVMPYYPPQPYYWIVYTPPPAPAPAPPPQVIYVEREPEPIREQPPQVVVVHLPPVAPPPAPAPVAPIAAAPVAPLPPRVPGPDVFLWTDDDGVVHYSTRVPPAARKKAKKLSTLAK